MDNINYRLCARTPGRSVKVFKATTLAGESCHFGIESLAKVWAGSGGFVEPVTFQELSLVDSGEAKVLSDEVKKAVAVEKERCAQLCELWNTANGAMLAKEIRKT